MYGNKKKFNRYWSTEGGLTIVELTQGQYTLLWTIHWLLIKHICWYAKWTNFTKSFYVEGWNPDIKKCVKMHRMILGLTKREERTDHINHNTVDNRYPENLRVVTVSENGMNKKSQYNNMSGTVGVSWHKRIQKYTVRININLKETHLGCFKTLEEAIIVRKEAEIKYYKNYRYKKEEDVTLPLNVL